MFKFTGECFEIELLAKFGEVKIIDAYHRLCKTCARTEYADDENWREVDCSLDPITSDGKDCPYYQRKDS
jgi:hypothetical protein